MNASIPLLLTDAGRHEALVRASRDWPSWALTPTQAAHLELMVNGGFAPLDRFMTGAEADLCTREHRLSDGSPFACPIVLAVSASCAAAAHASRHLVLRDGEGVALATIEVADVWSAGDSFVAGAVTGLALPRHYDSLSVRFAPAQVRSLIAARGWGAAVLYPTRGLVNRAEYDATRRAIDHAGGGLVLMALVDPADDEIGRVTRVRCLEAVLARYGKDEVVLWLVPLPRSADATQDLLTAAVVGRNAGCSHLLATGARDSGAQDLPDFARRLKLEVLEAPPAPEMPDIFPEVAEEIARRHPPRHRQGFTVFFTGLSGSGKSTIANLVRVKLLERTGRPVTLLDGDLVRQHLSSELGFSREHRELNVKRIGFVASEITKHGGIAICAPIAPYESVRRDVRQAIAAVGGFVLVFVDTPLEICEARDRKGLYAKARAGLIPEFTGVSDPYERPSDPELVIATETEPAEDAAARVVTFLEVLGYLEHRHKP